VVAGARGLWVAAMAPVGLLAFVVLVVTSPYRVNRIIAFLDPYADARGIGYHIIQSLEAISGGGLAGRGLGNSELKFGYLPEATTDFIYSIVAEELGIAGSAVVVGLYVLFILCGLAVIAASARGAGASVAGAAPGQGEGAAPGAGEPELLSNFARLLGFGIVLTVGVQALINICVVTGLAPTKGIALPLMSRGGTGWILTCLSIGLLISMDRAADRRRRELGIPVPGEEHDPFLQPAAQGGAAGAA
jgi:cell division protein FtsW